MIHYVEERYGSRAGESEEDRVEQEETDGENESYVPYAAAVPPVPDFHDVFRNDRGRDLYMPFSAEAKRVSEAKEEEEEEPIYLKRSTWCPSF